jgi:hypothetical protein
MNSDRSSRPIPLWIKVAYTAFIAILVPLYLRDYGPTNFLYFCDVAAFLTLAAVWTESSLLASAAAVGIVLPQLLWVVDFGAQFIGLKLTGMSAYMFNSKLPLETRLISLFHGWLPFLLLFVVKRRRYDPLGFALWMAIAWPLMLICYFWLPRPGAVLARPLQPVNINYVYGLSDAAPQAWMPASAWLLLMMIGLPLLLWWPTHLTLRRWFA